MVEVIEKPFCCFGLWFWPLTIIYLLMPGWRSAIDVTIFLLLRESEERN